MFEPIFDKFSFILNANHYGDVIMGMMASQITSLIIVYSTFYLGADQRKHQNSASLALVRGIHRGPVNYPHKGPVTQKMFPFDDVIMIFLHVGQNVQHMILADTWRVDVSNWFQEHIFVFYLMINLKYGPAANYSTWFQKLCYHAVRNDQQVYIKC